MSRRAFLKKLALSSALAAFPSTFIYAHELQNTANSISHIKTSLNAYSFNSLLRAGDLDLFDLIDFCAQTGFAALDMTGYYFPDYPNAPTDEYIYQLKRKAFLSGIEISGTGVRNNFSNPDKAARQKDIALIKEWIIVAAKLGAPVIRIFAGKELAAEYSWEQTANWMAKDIRECVQFGKTHGVVVAMQNHNDFIKTSEQIESIINKVDHEWFGLILDIGSLRQGNPYDEIARVVEYAVSWQVKENVYFDGAPVQTDYAQIINIARAAGFRGYMPLETLVKTDIPKRVKQLYREFTSQL